MSLAALTVLLVAGVLPSGQAEAKRPPQPVVFEELGRLKSIEVQPVESGRFSPDHRTPLPPEIAEYVRTTLQGENRLRYASPGEGVLSLRCENDRCSRIRAEVRTRTEDGQTDGPVVWHAVRKYRPALFHFLPDPQRFARDIAARLTNDYEQSLRALPLKIEINED
jgi:hypothetical protein